ncbi:type I-B CRISPR-associated endonuclease Cas1b [Hydrogenobacter sp. T-2]|uniref:type I-B CRISPR-associated endonuclease Cas1b n=1 Tax=Pampinifervens diazotrophicum TaxID=1632018 RepID=UPI002B25F64C|nr:type I-B CRISPR-associated endonuclease Cas1b [Hydrogenobacter sp. T-2]WPM32682.1 type I-B CRISPR-associated endonuclease Cas1b [Hydrogenobacter sp. T-2]
MLNAMRNYYIFKSGRLSRKDNSIMFETQEEFKSIPVNDIDSLYIFGEVDINTKALNFLAQKGIVVHIFNYYGWWTGSLYPREELLAGEVVIRQAEHYLDRNKRIEIAREFVKGAIHGFVYNLKRYKHKDIGKEIFQQLDNYLNLVNEQEDIPSLMGIEGNARDLYYDMFPNIIRQDIEFDKRVKRPPNNIMNALISFVNSLVYTAVLKEIYRTQLNPTISYLHEPSYRRFSLALDVAEIFKPIYGDRTIFDLLNNRSITEDHFDKDLNYCYLKETGRKIVVKAFEEKLNTTIKHKKLKRNVSYERIIRLELYKLIKHLLGEEVYKSFRIWW